MTGHRRNTARVARVVAVGDEAVLVGAAGEAAEAGHDVTRLQSLRGAVGRIAELNPDVILVAARESHDGSSLHLCRSVRENPVLTHPAIFLMSLSILDQSTRLEAIRAGVSHVFEAPVDYDELLVRIDVVLDARRDAGRALASSLVDVETGLYNASGLARRTRELSAEAMRRHTTIACIVLSASVDGIDPSASAGNRAAEVLRTLGRTSDVVARVGPLDFVLLAPSTSPKGAVQLARRLSTAYRVALIQALPENARIRVFAGHSSLSNLAYSPLEPAEILARATTALRSGRGAPHFEWLPPPETDLLGDRGVIVA